MVGSLPAIFLSKAKLFFIQYNLLNLPDKIHFTVGHKNLYTYNAGGQKLKVISYTTNQMLNIPLGTITPLSSTPSDYTVLTTDYVGNMIYENGVLKEILLPEGYYHNGVFYYYLKDHLGNNRVTINSSGAVVEKSHYYPSGTRFFPESTSDSSALAYRYNGKEMETMNGLNQMDYGARRRFSWNSSWTGVDPLAEQYYSISPYAYCAGNLINCFDPDGRVILPYILRTLTINGAANREEYRSYNTTISAMTTFAKTSFGNEFIASFLDKGTTQYGVKGNGQYSDCTFSIRQVNFENASAQGSFMPDDGEVKFREIDGRLNITMSLDMKRYDNTLKLVELITHELALHLTDFKSIIEAYKKGGIDAMNKILDKKGFQGDNDHRDLINNNKKNKGVKTYNQTRDQLIELYPDLKETFDDEMDKYQENYGN